MSAYAALLRGVNVGKGNRVPMADLRALLSELGFEHVTTLLNSGNAVFMARRATPDSLARRIADALRARLSVDVAVIVKSASEFDAIVQANPFEASTFDSSRLLVAFVQAPADLPGLAAVAERAVAPERFAVGAQAAYLDCANGIHTSKAAIALLGKAGKAATTRNWATTLKLQALLAEH